MPAPLAKISGGAWHARQIMWRIKKRKWLVAGILKVFSVITVLYIFLQRKGVIYQMQITQMHVQHVVCMLIRKTKLLQLEVRTDYSKCAHKILDKNSIQNWYLINIRKKLFLLCRVMPIHQLPWQNDLHGAREFFFPDQHSGPAL